METVKLKATKRDMDVKPKDYREQGFVTAEYYGGGVENQSLLIDYQDFRRAYKAAGKSTVLELELGDGKTTYALIHEVDYHPVSDQYIHVDFLHIDLNKDVVTKIPLVFVGEPPAVKELKGTFVHALEAVEVKCLAKDLVSSMDVDVSSLVDFNSVIRVSDLKFPEGYTVMADPNDTVAIVTPTREEKEEEVVPVDQIPVAGEEGKVGEEGAEGEAGGEAKAKE